MSNYLDILKEALDAAKNTKNVEPIAWRKRSLYVLSWSLHPYTKSPFACWCAVNLETIRALGLDAVVDEDGVSFFGPGCDTWHTDEAGPKIIKFNNVLRSHGIYAEYWDTNDIRFAYAQMGDRDMDPKDYVEKQGK